jgi:N-methylhydantoinase A
MLGVDVGGTFTDVVSVRDGRIEVTKVPSDASRPAAPVVEGARRLGAQGQAIFNHASTMGLNAVITRRLPKIGFLTTEGHRDMLDRGRVWRPLDAQTDPSWRRSFGDVSRPLVPRYLRRGVRERLLADGSELLPLDDEQAIRQLELLGRCDVQGVAICLLNSYVNPVHEHRLRELTLEVLGDVAVSISSETSPLAKEYARASTTVIDVFMRLIFTGYARELDAGLAALGFDGELNFADCAATLLPWREALEQPFRIVFAGPAAGTVSSIRFCEGTGERNLLCCDVGGTSTDVSLVVDGKPFVDNTFELEHDLIINALSTQISSVGAGGGSIVSVSQSGDVQVGPASAGSVPGPACYARGGQQPTITDACLLIGILDPERFAGGELELDVDAARRAFDSLDTGLTLQQRVSFAYRIVAANIAGELTNLAVRNGVDPRDFTVVAYGAAGPMLLPAALRELQVKRLVIPPYPGLFSALGLLSTDLVYYDSRSAYVLLSPDAAPHIAAVYDEMERGLRARAGAAAEGAVVRRSFDGRLWGQSWETPFVSVPDGPISAATIGELVDRFHAEYRRRYGNSFPYIPVQGVSYRVELVVEAPKVEYPGAEVGETAPVEPDATIELRFLADQPIAAGEYVRERLPPGSRVRGPAVIREDLATTFVVGGQTAEVGRYGELAITQDEPA